ncbi:MAG: hypothetical protein AAF349_28615 [Cyanobacteria bacterium P01_A01_bin.68]
MNRIEPIENEQVFVTSLEKFISCADKFIKIYYSGVSDEDDVQEIIQDLKNLILDTDY